jgi:hypothetical protein
MAEVASELSKTLMEIRKMDAKELFLGNPSDLHCELDEHTELVNYISSSPILNKLTITNPNSWNEDRWTTLIQAIADSPSLQSLDITWRERTEANGFRLIDDSLTKQERQHNQNYEDFRRFEMLARALILNKNVKLFTFGPSDYRGGVANHVTALVQSRSGLSQTSKQTKTELEAELDLTQALNTARPELQKADTYCFGCRSQHEDLVMPKAKNQKSSSCVIL